MIDNLQNDSKNKVITKQQIETINHEKTEYKLIGSYLRTKGLNLYGYDIMNDKLFEIKIKHGNTIHLTRNANGKLCTVDLEFQKAIVDSRHEHFESLNWKNAQKRVNNYKLGKIKQLCNLKEHGYGINFY